MFTPGIRACLQVYYPRPPARRYGTFELGDNKAAPRVPDARMRLALQQLQRWKLVYMIHLGSILNNSTTSMGIHDCR